SVRGFVQRGQDPHGGGLAGPIGADKAEDLPRRERKGNVIHRPGAAEVLLEADDVDSHGCLVSVGCRVRSVFGPEISQITSSSYCPKTERTLRFSRPCMVSGRRERTSKKPLEQVLARDRSSGESSRFSSFRNRHPLDTSTSAGRF